MLTQWGEGIYQQSINGSYQGMLSERDCSVLLTSLLGKQGGNTSLPDMLKQGD
jgi:hypothetical protein